MILISVCGARPNFMKIAPVAHALKGVKQRVGDSGTLAHYL